MKEFEVLKFHVVPHWLIQIIANHRELMKQGEVLLKFCVVPHRRAVKEASDIYEIIQQLDNFKAAANRLIREMKEGLHSIPTLYLKDKLLGFLLLLLCFMLFYFEQCVFGSL